jgi:hypothetical protein
VRTATALLAVTLAARASVDRLILVYQPLAEPQGEIRIMPVPVRTAYSDPETSVAAVARPNRVLSVPERLQADLNLVSLCGIGLRCTAAGPESTEVELALQELSVPEDLPYGEREVVEAAIRCLALTLKGLGRGSMELSVLAPEESAERWEPYRRRYAWKMPRRQRAED